MSRFRRISRSGTSVTIHVDGDPVAATVGDSVATALLAAGRASFATSGRTGRALAPYCLIGACFGCLCEIDGRAQAQACLTPVREGLQVRTSLPRNRADDRDRADDRNGADDAG